MGNVTITCICPLCGSTTYVSCKESQWNAYENGVLAQEAFEDLTVCAREAIISGMCPDCQEAFYCEVEEDDDDDPCDGVCVLCQYGDDCPFSDNC